MLTVPKGYTGTFVLIKSLLISLTFLVSKQYDTSSAIFYPGPMLGSSSFTNAISTMIRRLCIWDTVYYVSAAERGQLIYEQEWAFGQNWSLLIRFLTPKWLMISDSLADVYYYALVGVIVANASHYLAGLVLYKLTIILSRDRKYARVTALVFACTPAGMFMVSAYAEPLYALLSFTAMLARERGVWYLGGPLFALSVGLRSNGLFWGIFYLYDLLIALKAQNLTKSVIAISQGLLIGGAFAALQYRGYSEFCQGENSPDWCSSRIPLIYSYVQAKYWNNGFLKYWTPNNIPNFLFGAPTLIIMYRGLASYKWPSRYLPYLIIHAIMGVGALFFWHVQIITRVSTCLPTIYWYIAITFRLAKFEASCIMTYIAIWLIVQGILFSAYLPPA